MRYDTRRSRLIKSSNSYSITPWSDNRIHDARYAPGRAAGSTYCNRWSVAVKETGARSRPWQCLSILSSLAQNQRSPAIRPVFRPQAVRSLRSVPSARSAVCQAMIVPEGAFGTRPRPVPTRYWARQDGRPNFGPGAEKSEQINLPEAASDDRLLTVEAACSSAPVARPSASLEWPLPASASAARSFRSAALTCGGSTAGGCSNSTRASATGEPRRAERAPPSSVGRRAPATGHRATTPGVRRRASASSARPFPARNATPSTWYG
jgi:hypothetical protein